MKLYKLYKNQNKNAKFSSLASDLLTARHWENISVSNPFTSLQVPVKFEFEC